MTDLNGSAISPAQGQGKTVLVTGGSGFVGGWMILSLLQRGYTVRATLRTLGRQDSIRSIIAANGGAVDRLSFVAADLGEDTGWEAAVAGCDYVIHTASPITQGGRNGADLVSPARDGALRVLRASAEADVKRVVMTSSLNAAQLPTTGPKAYVTDEQRWTDADEPGLAEYPRSKTLAERAAWSFIETSGSGLTLATILPGMIIGPVLSPDAHGSVELIQRLMTGRMPLVPRLGYIMSDVRDLVDIHLAAMTEPAAANQRFAAAGDFLWLTEVTALLKVRYGDDLPKISTRTMPDLILRVAALFQQEARFIVPMLGQKIEADVSKAATLLNWSPRASATAVIDCADSLIRHGLVETPR